LNLQKNIENILLLPFITHVIQKNLYFFETHQLLEV
jgi:hypothetical protein